MKTEYVQIQKRYQITVPKLVRDELELEEGDILIWECCEEGGAKVFKGKVSR